MPDGRLAPSVHARTMRTNLRRFFLFVLALATMVAASPGGAKAQVTAPVVTNVFIESSPVSGDTYELGEVIDVRVDFDRNVTVTGWPQLALGIGSATRQARFWGTVWGGGGHDLLIFQYTVQASDSDTDGISVAAGALTLNGGSINDASDGTTAASLGLGTHVITNSSSHKVDGTRVTAPVVSGVTITGRPSSGDTYELGEVINVRVDFNKAVDVGGTPQLALGIGSVTRQADYRNVGTPTRDVWFAYTVQASDVDTDGLSVAATALTLNSGRIDVAGGTVDALLGLGTHAITNDGDHKVDGATVTTPAVTNVYLGSGPASGGTYELGEVIQVRVDFSRNVTVTGTPQLALGIGSATRQADYAWGTGTRFLTFRYTVQASDSDTDGLSVAAGALTLNGGRIAAGGTADALLGLGTHAVTNDGDHKVDGASVTAPVVTGVRIDSPLSGDTYELGEVFRVQVTFDRTLTVSGRPQLALGIGSQTRQMDFDCCRSGASLWFRYTVQASDSDNDGLSIGANALTLNGGTINDARDGTTAASLGLGTHAITNSSDHKVDGARATAPVVTDMWINSPVVGDTYELGEVIRVQVTFNKAVDVGGTPQLALGIGSATRQADYAWGTGGRFPTFQYTVQASDVDTDGLSVAATALTLNGGRIDVAGGTVDALLGLGTHAVTNDGDRKVDGASVTAPVVTGVRIDSPLSGDTYELGEVFRVQVTFDRTLTVSGRPQLALGIGSQTRQMDFDCCRSGASLWFRYTVQASDSDNDGLSIGANALTLNGGTINDARDGTTAASLGLGTHAITNSSDHKVDGARATAPVVTGMWINSPVVGDTYELGEVIRVQVTFNKAVDVGGTPQLALGIGSATRQADYAWGTGGRFPTFQYTVQASDVDTDGLSVAATALTLNGGRIDVAGGTVDALLGLGTHAVTNDGDHKVDGASVTAPVVTGVRIVNSPVSGDTYELGELIEVVVDFNRTVTVTGTPRLALGIGSQTRQVDFDCCGGSRTSLWFRYTVQASDSDNDGLSIGANALTLNGGSINDARDGTTAASLGLGTHAITNSSGHKVDGASVTAPVVTGVRIVNSPVSGDTYELGEVIEVRVDFNRTVTVTGTPRLALGIGSQTRQVDFYCCGGSRTALWFHYVVQASDSDTDGLSVAAGALTLNGGSINDARDGTTAASLGLGTHAITNSSGHKVDGARATAPVVTAVWIDSPAVGDTYELGEAIVVTVVFNKAVDVGGAPQLALGIGSATRQADYHTGTGGRFPTFQYTVQASDVDIDGLSVAATALTLNGGRIDVAGGTVDALLGLGTHAITNNGNHRVDGAQGPPGVTGVAIGPPAVGDTFERGEAIEVTVTFNKAVDVGGAPQLALGIGSATRQASYISGTGTASLVFKYTVASGDADNDGLSIGANALSLNSGRIDVAGGALDALLGLGANAIENSSGHKVAGGTLTAAAVSVAAIASTPASGNTYVRGEQIEVAVTFNRPVTVTGTPQLALGIGTETRQADYASGTGTASLTFRYTVVAADSDSDGLSVGTSALTLNTGAINDARDATVAASLGLGTNAITNSASHKVDGSIAAASVDDVSFSSLPASGDTYGLAEWIEVRVTFDRAVVVTGTPQLALGIGSATRQASYDSGTGTASLTFAYAVQPADEDTDGISVGPGALALNGGTIINAVDGVRPATLALGAHAISNDALHKVDGTVETAPAVSGVSVASSPGASGAYGPGSVIVVHVAFDRLVEVTGEPQLALAIGQERRRAAYASGSGTAVLVFRYVVLGADVDPDGFSVPEDALDLNGGQIVIAGGSAGAELGLGSHAMSDLDGHGVNGGGGTDPYFGVSKYEFELTEDVAGPLVVGTMGATDPYGGELTYVLGDGSEGLFELDASSGELTYVGTGEDAERRSEYLMEVRAEASDGRVGTALASVKVLNVNDAPVFVAEEFAFELAENAVGPVVLGVAEAVDEDEGDTLTYSLASGDAERFEVDGETGEVRYVGGGEDYEGGGPGSWKLLVSATDLAGSRAWATVAVALTNMNDAPVFVKEEFPFELAENAAGPVSLGVAEAVDEDEGDALTYRLEAGDGERFEVDGETGEVRYVGGGEDYEGGGPGSWELEVSATDLAGSSARATVAVALTHVNDAPVFVKEEFPFELKENAAGPVSLGVAEAVDEDEDDALTYRLEAGDGERFEVDGETGEVRYVGGGEDYEGGGPRSWELEVSVADLAGSSARATVAVALTNVNEAPAFADSAYAFELAENAVGPVVLERVTATDPDAEDMLTYSLAVGDAARFEVDGASGEVRYVGAGEDAETGPASWELEVVVADRNGLTDRASVTVALVDRNEGPRFGKPSYEYEVEENAPGPIDLGVVGATDPDRADTLTYSLAGEDAARFEVDGTSGEVRYVGAGEDAETGPAGWEFEVVVADRDGLTDRAPVTVALVDVNEAPAFADSAYAFELAENAAGPVSLGQVGATDEDAGDVLTYSLAGGDAERFEVDPTSGEVRYVGAGEDAETGPAGWELEVVVADRDGLTDRVPATVVLVDVNEAPAFADSAYAFDLAENAAGPVSLGRMEATDEDAGDVLTYSLAGGDAARFEVDGASGEVRYVGAGEDAETGPAGWELEVVVADRGGLTDRAPVTVALVDVNEAPAFADSAYAFELAENVRGPRGLGRVEATDEDAGDMLTYGLASGDAARFEVDGTSGEVRYVGGGENYEDGPPRYALVVRVVDADGLADEAGVVVTVLDVNEGPEAVGGIAPKVLEAYGAAAEEELGPYFRDPDGDALSYAAESSAPGVALAAVTESGRLSIAPQAIGVATVTVRATDPGGLEAMQQVQVTVEASRSERARALKLALTAFGRSLGAETVDAIGGRLGVESSSALGRSHVRLGGRSVGCGAFGGGEKCGLATLARGASGLLGARLSIPAATLVGPAGGPGATIDAATLLFGGGGGVQGKGGFGFGGGGTYQGQQESAAKVEPGGLEFDPVSRRNLLSQSSFQLSFGGDDAASFGSDADSLDASPPQAAASRAGWTLWGQASAGEFEGVPDDGFALEGRTRSAYAGLDYRFGSGLLLGLAGSRSGMDSDFESGINGAGSVDARLTSLYPYLHWSPREGLGLWGAAGAGRGSADFEELAGGRFSTDLDMRMGALGARQELVGALALKADAFSVRIQSADATELAGVTANAQRVRLAPELSGQWAVGGASVRTRLELGGRLDRGDAETGMGAEAGAELGFTHRASGFSVDARGRTLLVHQAEDFKEWNASVALRLQPGRDQGGLSFSLEPSWGAAGGGGAGALWQTRGRLGPGPQAMAIAQDATDADAPGLTPNRLAMELGWGAVLPGGGQVRPFGRWSREGADGYRLNVGTQWSVLGGQPGEGQGQSAQGLRLMIDLFGEQVKTGLQPSERRMGLLGRIEFR